MNYVQHPYPAVYWAQVAVMLVAMSGAGVLLWKCAIGMWRDSQDLTEHESKSDLTAPAGKREQSGQ